MSLFEAVTSHDIKFFNKCLKDSNIDKRNRDGVACIHIAAGLDNIHFLEGLLKHGADVNCKTSEGLTPLHIAAMWGQAEQVRLLLDYGADVVERDHRGCDAYRYALEAQGENQHECLILIATHLNALVTMDESMFNENDLRSSPSPELHSDPSSLGNNSSLDKSEYEAASSDTLSLDCDNSGFSHKSYDSVMFQTAYGSPDMMSETPPEHINTEKLEGSPFITPRSKKRQQKRSLTDVCLFNGSFEENELDNIAGKQIIPSSSLIGKEPDEICHKMSTIFEVDGKSKMQTLNHYMTELSLDMLSNSGDSSDQLDESNSTMKGYDEHMSLRDVSDNSERNIDDSVRTPSDSVVNHEQDEIGNKTNIISCDQNHDDQHAIESENISHDQNGISQTEPESEDRPSTTGENLSNLVLDKHSKENDPGISEEKRSKINSTTLKNATQTLMGSTFIISSQDNKIDLKNHQNIFIPFENTCKKSISEKSPEDNNVVQLDVRTPEQTLIYDWKDCSMTSNCGDEPRICIPPSYHKLTTDEIKKRIIGFGEAPGPITAYTKEVYLRKLIKLEQGQTGKAEKKNSPFVQYPAEVRMVLLGRTPVPELSQLEEQIIKEFGDKKKQWREGNEKSSFNYLLLDPRVSCNLPARSKDLSNTEAFRLFILSVFYVGKGKRARPHAHLREAVKSQITGKVNKKISQIWDIWNAGLGVISLHVFQSAIPAEAFTREACMIDALGLPQLTNKVRGSYHGLCSNLPLRKRRNLGIFFFHKAYQIFLQEGERQIKRDDI